MENRRNRDNEFGQGLSVIPFLSEDETAALLDRLGVEVVSETHEEFACFCPFHGNHNTPSMSVSKDKNVFLCFNGMCAETGTLFDMVTRLNKGSTFYENLRLYESVKNYDTFKVQLKERKPVEMVKMDTAILDRFVKGLEEHPEARDYLHGRGFTDESIESFQLGYSAPQGLIVTPMFDYDGEFVGGIGRSIEGKVFKNLPGTKSALSLYNIHNAKKKDWVIIVESNFDAIRVAQAGYPNVVATLGGNFSKHHLEQIVRCFGKVVIMTDLDDKEIPKGRCRKCESQGLKFCKGHRWGRELGDRIAEECLKMGIIPRWAAEGCGIIYSEGIKDAGDMTDKYIRKVIENNISNFEYSTLELVKDYRR